MLFNKPLFCAVMILGSSYLMANSSSTLKNYELDKAHTRVGFEIAHLVISTVEGQFKQFSGSFVFDEKSNELKDAKIEIETASIDTNEIKRDNHLRTPEFFDATKFPKITFEGVKLVSTGGKPSQLVGTLDMHGVKKEIKLDVDYKGTVTDPWGNKKMVFNLKGTLNRKDFGLTWNKALEAGGVLVGEEVTLAMKVEANEAKEAAKLAPPSATTTPTPELKEKGAKLTPPPAPSTPKK